jgi:hypothetical protein
MPSSATIAWRAIVVALIALAPTVCIAQAHQRLIIAQSSDDEEEVPPRQRGVKVENDEPEEGVAEKRFPGMGASRRADPFDAGDERSRSAQVANPAKDVVTCEAGCDGPRGTVVYKKE